MNNILPIGSVVMINGGTKPVMIYGYLQQSALAENDLFDYIGVPYPEGNVLFEGYRSEEFEPWEKMLKTAVLRHESEE